ncbi:MAG TPA: Crp/Fnr family transcriptional regulator [Anaerolineales bacterium]
MDPIDEVLEELRKIPWFHELRDDHMRKIASISQIRPMKAGEVIFREGDTHESVYIVLQGRVALELFVPHRGRVRFYTAEPWEIFGWSSVTPNVHLRTAGATAVLDGALLKVDAAKLNGACEEDHDLGYLVMRRLARVVAGRLQVTRLQLLDMFANPETKNA